MLTQKTKTDLSIVHLAWWYPSSELGFRDRAQEITLSQQ